MKRIFIFIALIVLGLTAMSQNTSPLVVKDFSLKSNEIIDKEQIPKANRTDLDNHPICRIKVKAEGFEEDLMQKFVFVPNGLEITHSVFKNGMWYLHVSSKKNGEITIKYMGDCVFRLPYQLAPGKVYELTLGMETATLIIRSVPMEADIYVDGRKVGTGYGSQAVSIGAEHRYKVTCDGYYPKEGNVIFDKKEEKTLDVELELGSGFITITTDPSGADIYIDEVKVGTTPYRVKKIKLGQHSLEIKKYGYVSVADVVTIRKGDHNKQFDNIKLEVDPTAPKVINSPYYGKDENSTAPSVNSSNGTLVGKFSVSDGKQVYFSKGNLQYQASTNTWRFAENQWDIIGGDNKNISPTYNGWIDLFGWGTSGKNHGAVAYQPYSTSD